ncbi:dihydrofolate reductase family protein [Paenibacillus sp. N1-5-1-14]|uniref:dihydrofolate reductase family protein n=1 Tax=Paenibacillus radicibacter TaxID=2972488 RepID=UPI002158E5E0|nr:dihydrofolate reductase family protein [Paenibacillus radicibacter]MCR8642807.1 dihydrofolate reductase family protein [Paenibacillus radicibacter]
MGKNNKVVLYIAMSLDGYIARPNGDVDWLMAIDGDGDNGYCAFYETIGTVVMGRATYEEILVLSEEYPYIGKKNYVLSRSEQPAAPHVTFTSESLASLIPQLKEEAEGDVWIVGGGKVVKDCLDLGLIDEMEIAIAPTVLGEGIPLFPAGMKENVYTLTHAGTSGQFVMLKYKK